MDRDWKGEWARVEAEHRDAQEAARVLRAPSIGDEAKAHGRVMDRFREAAKHRQRFIDERQRADPTWSPDAPPPSAPV